jgi:hypothetical protein
LAYWISRICDEFPCYGPREAEQAWETAPVGWFEEIIEARHYARMKSLFDHVDSDEAAKRLPDTPLMTLVKEITADLIAAETSDRK